MTARMRARTSLEPAVLRVGNRPEDDALLGSRCNECGRIFFPQRQRCAACAEPTTVTIELARHGTLTSFTVLHRSPETSVIRAPYVLGEVTLPEGLKIYSLIRHPEGRDPTSGDRVVLQAVPLKTDGEGRDVVGYSFAMVDPDVMRSDA